MPLTTTVVTRVLRALGVAALLAMVSPAFAQSVVVQGNRRIDSETVRGYVGANDAETTKKLRDSGLFSSVRVSHAGGRTVISVSENNVINRVAVEGNSKLKSDQILPELQSKARGGYDPALVAADEQRIRDMYQRGGRAAAKVTSRTVDLPNGRIDVVFTIDEGVKTGVKTINFAGNQAFSTYRLKNIMQTTEMNFLSFLKSTDVYDPDRIASDEDLIRSFYLRNGYADFRVVSTDARYDPVQEGYNIVITVDEGPQYRVSSVNVESHFQDVDPNALNSAVKIHAGDVYNADQVQKSVDSITREVTRRGYAFSQARPRGDRDLASRSIALSFVVEDGPRVYIERINVRGNTRTREYVIRREFDIGEGDAYNRALIDRAERRLNSLGYFKKVKITNEPGLSPDRVVINVDVEDQPTGSFGVSGGYSTTDGLIAELSVSESNFLGRGQYVRLAVTEGQHSRGIEFNFTEPYFLDRRLAAGFDLFRKQTDNSRYSLYTNTITGLTLRLGVPITDELTFSPRYSIYQSKITIPNTTTQPFNDCLAPIVGYTPGTVGSPFPEDGVTNCVTNGEASLAIKQAQGSNITSAFGYSLNYSTLDNAKDPHDGIYAELRQDIAGAGGNSRWVRTTVEARYYKSFFEDIVAFAKVQGGDIFSYGDRPLRLVDNFNVGPTLVRGFAPGGLGPRDISPGIDSASNPLGGTKFFGGSLEAQFPIFGVPKDLGLKGAIFADAGTLFGYTGLTNFSSYVGLPAGSACQFYQPDATKAGYFVKQGNCVTVQDSHKLRSSVGASVIWASPLGPIRFDYAFVLSKDKYDVKQQFRFSGGSSF